MLKFQTADLIAQNKLYIGDGYRAKNSELANNGIPFARAGNIQDGFDFRNADFFPLATLHKVGNKKSELFDVVFTSKGSVGRIAFVSENVPDFVYSPQLCYWRSLDHKTIWPRYLYYWMNSNDFLDQANSVKGQTDMADYVSLSDQRRMWITLPPLPEQKAIASILGVLDDKIELNRSMNRTLEETARAIFKSWFVDFDPVVARAAGKKPFGMDAATATLFPDSFQDSELGMIPKGWRVGKIGDLLKRIPAGKKYSQKTANKKGKVPILDQGKSGVIGYHEKEPGVIASVENPIPVFANHTCYMRLITYPFSAIQNVLPFIGNQVDTVWLFYATYNLQEFVEYKGHWPDFIIKKIIIPDNKLTLKYREVIDNFITLFHSNEIEITNLETTRNLLLPQLMSGAISAVRAAAEVKGVL